MEGDADDDGDDALAIGEDATQERRLLREEMVGAAKVRLHRARARLKAELERECTFYRDPENVPRCDRKHEDDSEANEREALAAKNSPSGTCLPDPGLRHQVESRPNSGPTGHPNKEPDMIT